MKKSDAEVTEAIDLYKALGDDISYGPEDQSAEEGTGCRIFKLEMLEKIPVFLLFSTMYNGSVKCTSGNAQNSDF